MSHASDLTGQRFGRLTVIERTENDAYGNAMWSCVCDCGGRSARRASSLRLGTTRSCGCLAAEHSREIGRKFMMHGHTVRGTMSREYQSWRGMVQRCTNPNHIGYKYWGGRGITVCDEWRNDFTAFLRDMGPRPDGTSLDRIDNDSGYGPGNCRWATPKEQRNNRRKISC